MDAFLLTVYFLVVIYVLYQMALSLESQLEDKVIIHLDETFLTDQTQGQLSSQPEALRLKVRAVTEEGAIKDSKIKFPMLRLLLGNTPAISSIDPERLASMKTLGLNELAVSSMLQPKIDIWVKPTGQQPIKPLPYLSVTVKNGTPDMQIYLNWDHSSLEMFGQGNRIVRSTPNMPRDLSQAQIYSVINPGQTVTSNITVEKNYAYNPESGQMELGRPLINLKERLAMSKMTDPTKESKNVQPLYNLDLMVGIKPVTGQNRDIINLLVPFSFELEIKPDQIALPPLRWLLRRTDQNGQRLRSWFWGK
ncbi:MAG: hypothetical protein AAF716_12180 [Cyanobacteria bacterium P01_D01_bin.1]